MPSEFDQFADGFVAPEMESAFGERDSEGQLDGGSVGVMDAKDGVGTIPVPAIVSGETQSEKEDHSVFGNVATTQSEKTKIVTFRTSELRERKAKVALGVALEIDKQAWPIRRINHDGPIWVVVEVVRPVEHRGAKTTGRGR